jgi:hypothetical protein
MSFAGDECKLFVVFFNSPVPFAPSRPDVGPLFTTPILACMFSNGWQMKVKLSLRGEG